MKTCFVLLILVGISIFSSCKESPNSPKADAAEKRFTIHGKIISVDKTAKKAMVSHDDVVGYMPAMTMEFPIKEDWVLRDLKANDEIRGELVVADSGFWIENIGITEGIDPSQTPIPTNDGKAKEGAELPDFKLTNQNGKRINFNQFRGKVLALTFIYTRCPLPEFCPKMSINFSDAEKKIREDISLKDNLKLLSISIDPKFDTPETLRKYGAGYLGNPEKPIFDIWQLATGSEKETKDVAEFFGLYSVPDKDQITHSLRTAIVTPDGKIHRVVPGNEWTGDDLVREMQDVLKIDREGVK